MLLHQWFRIHNVPKSKLVHLYFIFRQQFLILSKVWWQVLLVLLYSLLVIGCNSYYANIFHVNWSAPLTLILGGVTALLVFRTNTAYDRYYEGRTIWSKMDQAIRILVRSIWIIMPESSGKDVVEKLTLTNFLLAYAIASKNYLREEYDHELQHFLRHFQQVVPKNKYDRYNGQMVLNYTQPSNLPLQILYIIANYVQTIKGRHTGDPAIPNIFYGELNTLAECLSGFERVKRKSFLDPYSIHLYHVIWVYILSLPFQMMERMGWWSVGIIGLTSYTFLVILEIGFQIENPFSDGDNALPLEDLCGVLKAEMNDILTSTLPNHNELFVSQKYFPIYNCKLTAHELSMKSIGEIQTLFRRQKEEQLHGLQTPHHLQEMPAF